MKRRRKAKILERITCLYQTCLYCVIGVKLKEAVKEYGFELVSEELDSDVRSIQVKYEGVGFTFDPIKDYLHSTLLEKQCDYKTL